MVYGYTHSGAAFAYGASAGEYNRGRGVGRFGGGGGSSVDRGARGGGRTGDPPGPVLIYVPPPLISSNSNLLMRLNVPLSLSLFNPQLVVVRGVEAVVVGVEGVEADPPTPTLTNPSPIPNQP